MTVGEILAEIRKLPPHERRELLERAAEQDDVSEPEGPAEQGFLEPVWAHVDDSTFAAFKKTVEDGRKEPWRSFE